MHACHLNEYGDYTSMISIRYIHNQWVCHDRERAHHAHNIRTGTLRASEAGGEGPSCRGESGRSLARAFLAQRMYIIYSRALRRRHPTRGTWRESVLIVYGACKCNCPTSLPSSPPIVVILVAARNRIKSKAIIARWL